MQWIFCMIIPWRFRACLKHMHKSGQTLFFLGQWLFKLVKACKHVTLIFFNWLNSMIPQAIQTASLPPLSPLFFLFFLTSARKRTVISIYDMLTQGPLKVGLFRAKSSLVLVNHNITGSPFQRLAKCNWCLLESFLRKINHGFIKVKV